MKQQQRMAIMKDLIKKIRPKGRMDAENRWWVSELLAADCERAWIHPGWKDTIHKWCEWLVYMKKKDERKDGGDASAKGGEDDQVCRRQCWTSPQNIEVNNVGRRSADFGARGGTREIAGSL